jgi:RNA polymerase sigma-70 factor (ECF subfamily)
MMTVSPAGCLTRPITPAEVCEGLSRRIYSLAWQMLRHDADAEDVTQEVLLQVTQRLETYRGEAELTTLLQRLSLNAVQALRRKRARQNAHLAGVWQRRSAHAIGRRSRTIATPEKRVIQHEGKGLLDRAMRNLEDKYRCVYVLSELEGLSHQEIAAALGLSLAAVTTWLHRGRQPLRQGLGAFCAALDPHRSASAVGH